MLLQILDRPISYHRCFVDIGGSITAAVFLSQAFYWQGRTTLEGGWFFKTREEWTGETGMSRPEQETARKHLKEVGVLEEKLTGIPARLHYRVNLAKIEELLGKIGLPTRWRESSQQAGGNPANRQAGIQPTTRSESTAESTAESGGTTNHASLDSIAEHFLKESDYSPEEIQLAYDQFEAGQDETGYWMWGRRRVADWRSAMGARMAENRLRYSKLKPKENPFAA